MTRGGEFLVTEAKASMILTTTVHVHKHSLKITLTQKSSIKFVLI